MRRGGAVVASFLGTVLATGCGAPGGPMMTKEERAALGTAEERAKGYGQGRNKRDWVPACEAAWNKALKGDLGPDHIFAIEYQAFGPQLYDAYGLYWGGSGPFRTLRAHLPYGHLGDARWIPGELPRSDGESLLQRISELAPLEMKGDRSKTERVHGAGWVRFHVKIGSRQNEFLVYAPYFLASVGGDTKPRDLLLMLLEVAPEQVQGS